MLVAGVRGEGQCLAALCESVRGALNWDSHSDPYEGKNDLDEINLGPRDHQDNTSESYSRVGIQVTATPY